MPAVSVVVPCYNGGAFLDALTASLRAQSFRDFEVVIVNDGSTDALTREKLARLDPAIRVVHQDNRGLSAARNAGFRAASADLVLPLDCDDTLEPTHLAETVPVLRRAPLEVGFVYTNERLVGARAGVAEFRFNPFDQLFVNRLSYCLLLRKSAWAAVGGYDENMRDGYEDWEFNIRLAKAGFRGAHVPKALVSYLVSDSGMLMNKSSRLHGALWRRIRTKHRDLYRLPTLLRLWARHRSESSAVPLPVALGLLAVAAVLPETWFSALIYRVRRSRMTALTPAPAA